MADELSRGVCQRYGLLKEIVAKLFNREYPVEQILASNRVVFMVMMDSGGGGVVRRTD